MYNISINCNICIYLNNKKKTESSCNSDEFECYDRTCIDKRLVCNQYQDCNEGEDEENCEGKLILN